MKDDVKQEKDRISSSPKNPYQVGPYFGSKGKSSGFRSNQPDGEPIDNTKGGNEGGYRK